MREKIAPRFLSYLLYRIGGSHDDQSVGVKQSFENLIKLILRSHVFYDRVGIANRTEVAAGQLFKESIHGLHCDRKLRLYTAGM